MTKADEAYALLSEMIESGALEPGGFHTEAALVEMTEFGRTPVREAVQRLDRDHLLRIHTGRGVEIPGLGVDAQLRRLEVRRSLETLAATLACERASTTELDRIRVLKAELDNTEALSEYVKILRATHIALSVASHNEYLADAMTPLQVLSRRFWLAHIVDEAHEVTRGKSLHTHLLTALLDRDAPEARQASTALNDYLIEFARSISDRYAHPVSY